MKHTPGPWRTEVVSDAVRVVAQARSKDRLNRKPGGIKVILARLCQPQLPEAETSANARLMAASPDLYDSLLETREVAAACFRAVAKLDLIDMFLAELPSGLAENSQGFGQRADAALDKALGRAQTSEQGEDPASDKQNKGTAS